MSSEKRKFTIQGSDLGFEGGKYVSKEPILAARKAAKQLFRMAANKDNKKAWDKYGRFKGWKVIKFIIRETSRGSNRDTYSYEGMVVDLPEPKVIKRGDKEYTVTKVVKVKALLEHDTAGLKRSKKSA